MAQGFDYLDLGGGLNEGSAPAAVNSREMVALANWYPFHTRLRRRGGVRRVTTASAWSQQITAMHPLNRSTGAWELIVGGQSGFGKLATDRVNDISLSGFSLSPSNVPWSLFQYKNYLYAIRPGAPMIRILDTARQAGLTPPATAMTLAAGAAGALSAGNYKSVVTFGNQETELESNPSPVSNTLALGANLTINYSGIPVSEDSFINMRRIYRVLPDQSDVYFFVHQINDNISTTFTGDNVVVADLGPTVSFNNGLPPTGLKVGVIWNERAMATDGRDLYYSEFLLAEAFGEESVLPVTPDDGHEIRGLHPLGDRLVIGKTNKMLYLIGSTAATFGLHVLDDVHGCVSHYSMQSAEGTMFWLGTGKKVFRTDGTSVRDITTPRIKATLEAVPDDLEEFTVGAVYPANNWYVLSIPQTGHSTNRKVLVYNYKYDAWTIFTHPSDAPQFLGNFFNENFGHVLYSTFYDNHLYVYNDETYGTDWGNPIVATGTTKADDFGAPGYRKAYDQVWLLVPQVSGGTMRLEALADEQAVAILDRTVSLDLPNMPMKPYKFPTWGSPWSKGQLRFTYSGEQQIDLDQIHFEVGILQRRPGRPK